MVKADSVKEKSMEKYSETKTMIQEKLKASTGKKSFTIDLWDSKYQKLAYMAVTAHWMDEEWVVQNELIAFRFVGKDHTGTFRLKRGIYLPNI